MGGVGGINKVVVGAGGLQWSLVTTVAPSPS